MPKAKKAKSKLLSAFPRPDDAAPPTSLPTVPVKNAAAKSRAAQSAIVVTARDTPVPSLITTCGQRFAVCQIGSMFGRE